MSNPKTESEEGPLVWFNVSGTKFCSSRSCLLSSEKTFFHGLLRAQIPSSRDSKGRYFIARNPLYFQAVLDFLQCGSYELLPGMTSGRMDEELAYFGLQAQALEANKRRSNLEHHNLDNHFCSILVTQADEQWSRWKQEHASLCAQIASQTIERFHKLLANRKRLMCMVFNYTNSEDMLQKLIGRKPAPKYSGHASAVNNLCSRDNCIVNEVWCQFLTVNPQQFFHYMKEVHQLTLVIFSEEDENELVHIGENDRDALFCTRGTYGMFGGAAPRISVKPSFSFKWVNPHPK